MAVVPVVVVALLGGVPSAAEETDPVIPEPSPLAESFPTLFAPPTDAERAALLGTVEPTGGVPIENAPGDGSISLDPSVGMVFEYGSGESVGVTRTGPASSGIAGDTAVTYSSPDGDWAARPTADGGGEIIDELPAGTTRTTYEFDLPGGTRLAELENGDVAVVRDGAVPMPEIASAAEDLAGAETTVVEASAEELLATEEDGAFNDASIEMSVHGDDLLASDEPVEPEGDYTTEDGSVPAYLEPEASLETLRDAADTLEADLPADSFTAAEQEVVDVAQDNADAAHEARDIGSVAEGAAVDAAGVVEANDMLSEDLAAGDDDRLTDALSAELALGDPQAEVSRGVDAVVEAQSLLGNQLRVEGVFSAPISKTLDSQVPVPTVMEVEQDDTVVLTVPDTGETVVVDPFFVPVLIFVARIVVQRVAPVVVRAAANYARRKLGEHAARVAAQRARAAATQRVIQDQVRQRAAQAARAVQQARIWAAQKARARAAQSAQAFARAKAQAARARELARQSANRARERAAQAARDMRARKQSIEQAIAKAARTTSQRVVDAGKRNIERLVRAVQNGRKSLHSARQAVQARVTASLDKTRELLAQLGRRAYQRAADLGHRARTTIDAAVREAKLHPEVTGAVLGEGIEEALSDDNSCRVEAIVGPIPPTHPVDLIFIGSTAVRNCILSKQPGTAPGVDVYRNAQAEARQRGESFEGSAGADASAELLSVALPTSFPVGRQRFIQFRASNFGAALPLGETFIYAEAGIPGATTGTTDSGRKVVLTDENADGVWSKGETATGVVGVTPAVTTSRTERMSTTFITGSRVFGPTASFQMSVAGTPEAVRPSAASGMSGGVKLTWPAPVAGGGSISSYEVRRSDTGAIARVTATSHTWSGLSNGTTYSFTTRACSDLGCGPWSSSVSGKPYTVPSAPARPSISSLDNALRVAWSAPGNGGSTILRYEVAGSLSGTTTGTSHTFTRGQNADAQSMKVRACNAGGCGPYSSSSSSMRPKVIALARGARAPKGYHYDTRVYGPAGWRTTITCNDGRSRGWSPLTITLDGSGYWRSATRCYSGFANPHWVNAGGLRSNSINY